MSDNFWFKDNAFSGNSQQFDGVNNSPDDFLNSMFDQNAGQMSGNMNTTGGRSQGQPPNMQSRNVMGGQGMAGNPMYMKQDSDNGIGASGAGSLDHTKKEQLLRMRQQIMQQQMLQAQQKQQGQQQMSSQNLNLANNVQNTSPQAQAQASVRLKNMELSGGGVQSSARPQMPSNNNSGQNTPSQMQMQMQMQMPQNVSQQNLFNANNPAMSPQISNTPNPRFPRQAPEPSNKPPQSQISQLHVELFLTTLYDFMNRRGTSIPQPPVIGNKNVNLFFLYILSQKLGGSQQLVPTLQSSNQQYPNPWTLMSQKLGLFEGINIQQDVSRKLQVEKELGNCYVQYILPYEQYCATPDGSRDIQQRRLHFQKQLLMKFQQQQQQQASSQLQSQSHPNQAKQFYQSPNAQQTQPKPQPNQAQQSLQQNFQPHLQQQFQSQFPQPQQQQQQPFQSPTMHNSPHSATFQRVSPATNAMSPVFNNQTPATRQSPIISQAGTPQQRKPSRTGNVSNQSSPNIGTSPFSRAGSRSGSTVQHPQLNPQQAQIHQIQQSKVQSQIQSPHTQMNYDPQRVPSVGSRPNKRPSEDSSTQIAKEPKVDQTEIVRNYVPLKPILDTHGGYNIKSLSTVAGEVEIIKPVFLFAPELGAVNLHALTMALKNLTYGNNSEVVSSLNTLLVITSDSNYSFKISDSLELLDTLSSLGIKLLDFLVDRSKKDVYLDFDLDDNDNISNIFKKYAGTSKKMKNEDISYIVDSLTGEMIEEDESDFEFDDLFSTEERETSNSATPQSSTEETSEFALDDYLTSLHKFKEENRHHFSKIQTKSAVDEDLVLVEELITVTMILRNFSYVNFNRAVMAKNPLFKEFLFKTIKTVITHSGAFKFNRKRLSLFKDCLMILDNVSFYLELRSLQDAFLVVALISSFGPKTTGHHIPDTPLDIYTYLPYGIDALAKLLVKDPHKAYLQAIFDGTFQVNASSDFTHKLVITEKDRATTKKLIEAFVENKEEKNLGLHTILLLLSVLPFKATTFEFSKSIFSRSVTLSQALFGVKLMLDMISSDEPDAPVNKLLVQFLITNKEFLLSSLSRLSVTLVGETAKTPPSSHETRVLNMVLFKSLVVVNTLLAKSVDYYMVSEDNEMRESIRSLKDLSRVVPNKFSALDTYLAPAINKSLSKEVVRMVALYKKIA